MKFLMNRVYCLDATCTIIMIRRCLGILFVITSEDATEYGYCLRGGYKVITPLTLIIVYKPILTTNHTLGYDEVVGSNIVTVPREFFLESI